MIDYRKIEELQNADEVEPSLLPALIKIFLEQAPTLIKEMKKGLELGRWTDVLRAAHTLRGAGLTLGTQELAPLCEAIEEKAARQDLSGVEGLLRQLDNIYQQTKVELEKIHPAS